MTESGGCCRCCFSFIFTLGLTALFLWLSLRTSKPDFTISSFYLPSLNRTLNDTTNTTLFLKLMLKNTNKDKGVYYDALNLTVSLPTTNTNTNRSPIATASVPRFYQGHHKKATKSVVATVESGVHSNGSVSFRVDLATAVRYKIMLWKTKKQRLVVGADVEVNDSGAKVSSAPRDHLIGCFLCQVGALANLFVFIFVNFW